MDSSQLFFIGLAILIGSALQSAVGFGFGLLSIPVMIWAGVPLPVAVTILAIVVGAQTAWGCWHYRADLQWRLALPISLMRIATLPIGIFFLTLLADADKGVIRQVVGLLLLFVILLQWGVRVQPRAKVHPGWMVLAGSGSGVLGGLIGMGGPPITIWLMAHDWPTRQVRSFLWVVTLIAKPVRLFMLWFAFGETVLIAGAVGMAFIPVALVGSSSGLWLGGLMSKTHLRLATFSVLLVIAIGSVLTPILR